MNDHWRIYANSQYGKREAAMTLPLDDLTISAVQASMVAAIAKHGDRTPLNVLMHDMEKLPILVEEVGEVARAMTYDEGSRDALIKELLQTAAMAAAWAQSLDRPRPRP